MTNTRSEIKRYDDNLENKIKIVQRTIEFYEERISCGIYESKEKLERSLEREKGNLIKYKSQYPEFFI